MKKINNKIDTTLDMILKLPEERKQRSGYLKAGFETLNDTWELIVKHSSKNIKKIADELDADVEVIGKKFAIFTIEEEKIYLLLQYNEIEYIEKPRRIISSINTIKRYNLDVLEKHPTKDLYGEGVIIGIIDSGIDYNHLDFINEDGTTRILSIWDQSVFEGKPPKGFSRGTEWTKKDINKTLKDLKENKYVSIIHHVDALGHGTCVAGIAAGNGRTNRGSYSGLAPKSELIVVKLGAKGGEGFSRTTEFMRAIRYLVDKAKSLDKPIVINSNYGTFEGDHNENSLFESFINEILDEWKITMIVAAGNEGKSDHHFRGKIKEKQDAEIEIEVESEERIITLELWKNFYDIIDFELISPHGYTTGKINLDKDFQKLDIYNMECYLCLNSLNQQDKSQRSFMLILSKNDTIECGIWKLKIHGKSIVDGNLDIWLPMTEVVQEKTRFLKGEDSSTIQIPGTASKVITVGSYDTVTNSVCDFSGKGSLNLEEIIKPELVAPHKNIVNPIDKTYNNDLIGTGISTAYVTGTAALLMEWGIVKGNNPDLYGDKVKEILTKAAMRKNRNIKFPNNVWGFGSLWIKNSIRLAKTGEVGEYKDI